MYVSKEQAEGLILGYSTYACKLAAALHRKAPHIELCELLAAIQCGVVKASKKYNPKKGCSFSTFATYWAKKEALELISNYNYSLYVPKHIENLYVKVKRKSLVMPKELAIKKIARSSGLEEKRLHSEIENVKCACAYNVQSIEYIREEDDTSNFEAHIEDKLLVSQLLEAVNPREEGIIRDKFYLGLSNKEIGKKHKITGARVQQILIEAKLKMKRRYDKLCS